MNEPSPQPFILTTPASRQFCVWKPCYDAISPTSLSSPSLAWPVRIVSSRPSSRPLSNPSCWRGPIVSACKSLQISRTCPRSSNLSSLLAGPKTSRVEVLHALALPTTSVHSHGPSQLALNDSSWLYVTFPASFALHEIIVLGRNELLLLVQKTNFSPFFKSQLK